MTDILLTADGDLDFTADGDFAIAADATAQHQRDILLARPGDYRAAPRVGVGLEDYLDDENPTAMLQAIGRHLAADGMKDIKTNLTAAGELTIDAHY